MSRFLALLALAASASAQIDYTAVLDGLWNTTDTDGSGFLNQNEFDVALNNLGINVCTQSTCDLTLHSSSSALFAALDGCANATDTVCSGADGQLTKQELLNGMTFFPSYATPLQNAFTNGAGQAPDVGTLMPGAEVTDATATVSLTITLGVPPSSIYPGQRQAIRNYFATEAGVDPAAVIITFLPGATRRRKLQSAAATSTDMEVNMFVADAAAADAVSARLPADAAAMGAVPAFSGLRVTSMTEAEGSTTVPPFPTNGIIAAAAVLVVLGLSLCCIATVCSKRKFNREVAKGNVPAKKHWKGCCSYYAVKSWAFGELTATLLILAGVIWLFTRMDLLTNGIIGLIETALRLIASDVEAIASFGNQLPASVIDTIQSQLSQLRLLPIAVMVPGLLAVAFLLISSICAASNARKGSFCLSKCMMLFASVFLVLCFAFYIVFVVIGLALTFPPPSVARPINQIQTMCITIPAGLNQLVADNNIAIGHLEAAGQSVGEMRATLTTISEVVTQIGLGCGFIDDVFSGLFAIFLPAVVTIVAIVYAFWVNQMLCCAAGCCCSPPKSDGKISV